MAVLHQLMQSDERAWRDCLSFFLEGDAVLLVDEGVGLLVQPEVIDRLQKHVPRPRLAALQADLLARGLAASCEAHGIRMLSDDEWVEWVLMFERSLGWK